MELTPTCCRRWGSLASLPCSLVPCPRLTCPLTTTCRRVCTLIDCCVFDDPNWRALAQESCGVHSLSDSDGASALAGTSGIVTAMATFAALILA